MSDKEKPQALIDYYTDILCVWAWISQPRLDELQLQCGLQVRVRHRYVDIFGDSHNKIAERWGVHDGFENFNRHIVKSAAPFKDSPVNPDLWLDVMPRSSITSHLVLKAVELVAGDDELQNMSLKIRRAFFTDARDISQLTVLLELADEQKLDTGALENCLRDGSAMAALSNDQHNANDLAVKGSPTWVLNEGRQILYGNVGYRILHANIEELLKSPDTEASWC